MTLDSARLATVSSSPDQLDELAGQLVRLRGVRRDDAAAFLAFDRDTNGARHWGETNLPRTDDRQQAWLEELVTKEYKDHTTFLVVERLEDHAVIGSVSVGRASPRHGRFGYGIGLGSDYRGCGYGSEALTLLLRFYFGELRYMKCDTSVYSFNEASLHLHRKLGFQEEGRIRRAVFTNGDYHDEVLVGITAEEFFAHHGR